jgi:hypothetical protein
MSTAAAVGHHHHHHHPQIHHLSDGHAAHPGDPVLAAATAAAMDAAAPGAADGVDASATEAAVAATGTFVGGPDDDDDDEDAMPIVPGTKTRKNFEERLKELRKFKQKHGHCQVPHKFPQNPQLGTWVDTQRRLYRAHKRAPGRPTTLSQENIEKLLEVGFNFEPRPSREETWNARLAELAQYKSTHGHCNVREDDQTFPGLGKWVSYVRRQYRLIRQGRRSKDSKRLDTIRIQQLRDMGFIFELREEMAHKRFREGIQALREFVEENGHASVPNFYEKNPTLGLVVEEMKREATKLQNGQSSAMLGDMLAELIDLGLVSEMGSAQHAQEEANAAAAAAAAAAESLEQSFAGV